MKKITKSAQETKQLGQELARQLKAGQVLALAGELGAGKTTFVQGLAEFFGVDKDVTSPTFTLVNEYRIKNQSIIHDSKFMIRTLVHVDCYRLENVQELVDIGLQEYLDRKDSVLMIEWADKVRPVIPSTARWIYFQHGEEENERVIQLEL